MVIEVRLAPRLMRGIRLLLFMAEPLLRFQEVQHRHAVSAPRFWKPWATRPGAGIVGLSLNLYAGSVLGLVGPNGAGKTTLLRVMAGVLPIQSGSIHGQHTGEKDGEHIDLRTLVGHMPEQVRWQGKMTVMEALERLNEMRNGQHHQLNGLLNLVGLGTRSDEPLDNLSQGMRQRLSIAAALLGSPKVLLLDEPFNGLDPVAAEAFASLVRRLAEKGVSIVISSHMVAQLDGLIDRIALLHRGQLLDEGPLDEVEQRLGLAGRYVIQGRGPVDPSTLLEASDTACLDVQVRGSNWKIVVRGDEKALLNTCLTTSVDITAWGPARPNLVEWLCAATGMSLEDISLEVSTSAMLPLQSLEVSEDE